MHYDQELYKKAAQILMPPYHWQDPEIDEDYGIGLNRLELGVIQRHVKEAWEILRDDALSKEEAFDQLEEALATLMREVNV